MNPIQDIKHPEMEERLAAIAEAMREFSSDDNPVRAVRTYALFMRNLYTDQAIVSVSTRGLRPGEYRIMRLLHQAGVQWEGITDTLFAGADAPVHTGGIVGEIIKGGKPYITRSLDAANDPVVGVQFQQYRALIACPVFSVGELTNWVLFLHIDPNGFSATDVEFRMIQANLMGGVANEKRMTKEVIEANAYVQRQVDEIASIQRAMLPQRLPKVKGVQLAALYETYDRAGGDYYDIVPFSALDGGEGQDDPRWLIFLADASGHGPSAAVVVAMVASLLHSYPKLPDSPSEVLHHINKHLLKKHIYNSFVTAALGIYDPRDRSFEYSLAGHPPPLMRQFEGAVTQMPMLDGVPLGILPDSNFTTAKVTLEPSQCVLLYTDGITEARNPEGKMFGVAGLYQSMAICKGTADSSLQDIVDRLREHESGAHQDDDQTMLLIRVDGDCG